MIMAETKQLAFDLRELATALIKQADIHEGSWLAGFEFNLGAGNVGPTPEDVKPAAFVQIAKVLLFRQEASHPAHLAVDAAVLNPPSKRRTGKK
jgi:hypothetical protein